MTTTAYYGRTPIPADARPRARFVIPLWFAVIFSPFVAFAANGKVDDSDWTPALVTAGVAIFALVVLHARAKSNYANLPKWHRDEYAFGKLFAPLPRGASSPAAREFELAAPHAIVRLAAEGVTFSPAAWLDADRARRKEAVRALWHAARERRLNVPEHKIAWRDIAEWQVHDESEAADYYRLSLADGGHVRIRRPREARAEYDLLDAVRTTGQTAVRLFCDIAR